MAKKKKLEVDYGLQGQDTGLVREESLSEFSEKALKVYGSYVVEDRAIPDYRDGLKPVHRAILWSLVGLNLRPSGPYKKAARVVGEALGKYHPHGDCLEASTPFMCLDGNHRSIGEIYEEQPAYVGVLAYDEHTGTLVPAKAHSFRIGQMATKIYNVHLSDGSVRRVTGNHPIMGIQGDWIKAEDLREGDSLYHGVIDTGDYTSFSVLGESLNLLHKYIANHEGIDADIIHHVNHNTQDNSPSNLKGTTRAKHAKHHKDYLTGLCKEREKGLGDFNEVKNVQVLKAAARVVSDMYSDGVPMTWNTFQRYYDEYDESVNHRTLFENRNGMTVVDYIKSTMCEGRRTFKRFVQEHIAGRYCLHVDKILIECLDKPEPMYDFTVDGYENAVIFTGGNSGDFNNLMVVHNSSCFGAMVTIANTMPPVVDGQGNWGTPINPAAAMRYVESKLSRFAHLFMADNQYLDVVPKVPNYSGDDVIPLYLPALLPYMLFNGSIPVPAYGVRAGNPSFSFNSVVKVVIAGLKGKKLTAKALAKHLKIEHPYGCASLTSGDAFLDFIQEGRGNIVYAPLLSADVKAKTINVQSFVPSGLSSTSTIDKTLNKIASWPGVRKCFSKQGKKSKGSGPYGALFVIEANRNITEDAFHDLVDKVDKEITSSVNYRLGVTVRKEKNTEFHYMNYVRFFSVWIKYRIRLELALIKNLIAKAERELHVNKVYLFAVEHMKELLKVLPKVLTSKDPDKALSKALGLPVEDARIILDRKVRQLAKLEASSLKEKIANLEAELEQLRKDEKEPGLRAARDTAARAKAYLKKPDVIKSGLKLTE